MSSNDAPDNTSSDHTRTDNLQNEVTRPYGSMLGRIKPSYLVLLALLPLFIYLFIFNNTYQDALRFILPGIAMTVALTLCAYTLAFVWGLVLSGLQFLQKGRRSVLAFLVAGLLFGAAMGLLLLLPRQGYALIGSAEGTVAIIQGTPNNLVDAVRQGTYEEGAPERPFRSVPSAQAALDRIASGTYTGALVPREVVPEGTSTLWEPSVLPRSRLNLIVLAGVLSIFLLLLTFASWQSDEHPLAIFADLYIDIVRGIPMIVLIAFIGLVLPGELGKLGLLFEPDNRFLRNLQRGTLAVGFAYAAFMAEIFRAGIQAVPKGQREAARALGLSNAQVARFVVLPQALKIITPPLGNEFIAMFKDTALVSVIGTGDIFRLAREFGSARLNNIPPYNTAAVIYIALTIGASSVLRWLERRTDTERR